MKKLPLSVLIITHRDDDRLKKCLESVKWSDDVNLVKTNEKIMDFSKLKNEHLKQAKHDWILFLDSDEVVSKELLQTLPDHINQKKVAGFAIKRVDIFFGKELKWGETRDQHHVRLAQKSNVTFDRPVHEQAIIQGKIKKIRAPLYHYAHLTISEFCQKISHYATLEASFRYQKGKTTSWLELLSFPTGKFLYNYFWQLGFLDGTQGFIYSLMLSCHSLIVRAKLYEISQMGSKRA